MVAPMKTEWVVSLVGTQPWMRTNIWFVSGTKWLQLRKRAFMFIKGAKSFTVPLSYNKRKCSFYWVK